ncbi:L-threonine ammonia-lyase-like [Acropora palmata]|uniref:L-threonine ammonia-lyase-like n=1 Tax=Acropora palmata TaxID=6131 RepID=UPI003DA0A5B4
MTESSQEISLSDIFEAKERVKGILEPTLCAKTCFLEEFNIEVILKEENLSPTGSWFDRAVLNTLLSLSEDQRRRGVMAISEYRPFIRALFHFGPKLCVPATLVVPLGSEIEKGMLSRPGRVIVSCASHIEETKLQALEFAKRTGLEVIDSDHSHTMLVGLCTLGLEITEQCGPNLDAILVPYKCPSILTELRCFARCMLPHVEIIGVHLKTKKITRVSSCTDKIDNLHDAVLSISDAEVLQAVSRAIEEQHVNTESRIPIETSDVVSMGFAQTRTKRVVVVVPSDCLPH